MRVRQQRGESKLANLFWFAVIALGLYAAFNVTPAYYAKWNLQDKMVEICRLPRNNTDERIREMLWKEAAALDLHDILQNPSAFKIRTQDYKRQITVEWDQELKWVPGVKRVKHFAIEVDQPLI